MQIAKNPIFHYHTKQIEIDCHMLLEKIQREVIHLLPMESKNHLADILIEAFPKVSFYNFLSKLEIYNVFAPVCGGVLRTMKKKEDRGTRVSLFAVNKEKKEKWTEGLIIWIKKEELGLG